MVEQSQSFIKIGRLTLIFEYNVLGKVCMGRAQLAGTNLNENAHCTRCAGASDCQPAADELFRYGRSNAWASGLVSVQYFGRQSRG